MARKQGEVCARELKKPLAHGNTGAKRMKCRKPLKKAPKSHEIGKKRSELRKTARRLRLREKGAHDIEGLCELHNSHLVPKRYEETCKTAAFCLVLHVSYAPIGCCELCKMMNQKGGENAPQGDTERTDRGSGLAGTKKGKKEGNWVNADPDRSKAPKYRQETHR